MTDLINVAITLAVILASVLPCWIYLGRYYAKHPTNCTNEELARWIMDGRP